MIPEKQNQMNGFVIGQITAQEKCPNFSTWRKKPRAEETELGV
jgi:hypothetical protein